MHQPVTLNIAQPAMGFRALEINDLVSEPISLHPRERADSSAAAINAALTPFRRQSGSTYHPLDISNLAGPAAFGKRANGYFYKPTQTTLVSRANHSHCSLLALEHSRHLRFVIFAGTMRPESRSHAQPL
jgi:hypothetical protein